MDSNINYKELFKIIPLNCAIFSPNAPHFTILAANDYFIRTTFQSYEDVIGRGLFDAFPANEQSQKSKQLILASLYRAMDTLLPDTCATLRYDVPSPIENQFFAKYWSLTHTPILDQSRKVKFILQTAVDITHLVERGLPLN